MARKKIKCFEKFIHRSKIRKLLLYSPILLFGAFLNHAERMEIYFQCDFELKNTVVKSCLLLYLIIDFDSL